MTDICTDCGHGHHPAEGCDEAAYYRDLADDKHTLYLMPSEPGSALLRVAERDGTVVFEDFSGTALVRWMRACNVRVKKWAGE